MIDDRIQTAEDNDETLMTDVAGGDRRAFDSLLLRYQSKIINLCYCFLYDRHEAEDAAQEVFIKVWKNATTFKAESKFYTWLFRIAVNTCLNHRRGLNFQWLMKKKEEDPLDCESLHEQSMDSSNTNPHEKLEKAELQRIVNRAIRSLPDKQRMAIILSRFDGYSYTEIAAMMNTSLSSVESLLFRAKQKLAKILLPFKEKGEI